MEVGLETAALSCSASAADFFNPTKCCTVFLFDTKKVKAIDLALCCIFNFLMLAAFLDDSIQMKVSKVQ